MPEVQFNNPLDDSDQNDLSTLAEPEKGDSKQSINPLNKLRSVDRGSDDIETALSFRSSARNIIGRKMSTDDDLPKPDPNVTEGQLRSVFEKIDTDGSGELDKSEVRLAAAELGANWSDKQLQEVFNLMDDDGNTNGFVDFEEFASYWLGADWSPAELSDKDDGATTATNASGGLGAQCGKIRQFMRRKEAAMHKRKAKKKEKQVEPESVFVMSADGRRSSDRERAELMDKIQEIHENEFHRLEDAFNTHAESRVEAEVWESCAREQFSEEEAVLELNWQKHHKEAARRTIMDSIEEETKSNVIRDDGIGRGDLINVAWRCFLKEELAFMRSGGQGTHRMSSFDTEENGLMPQIIDAARAFVNANHGELEAIMDSETLPIDAAVEAVIASLTEEVRSRDNTIEGLVSRQNQLADSTPRKIKVSGLQGDAAVANGIYCADGLRACWGRPVYLQQVDSGSDREPYFLYYDQSYVKDDKTGISEWADGMWIIGPTQNSDRCTAYMPEVVQDGVVVDLLHPCCNASAYWMVYDVVKKKWVQGPGDHCPALSVSEVANDTYQDYIGKSISEQREMRNMIARQVESSGFEAQVRKKLSANSLRKSEGGGIRRKTYMMQVRKFHAKELRKMQSTIISNILSAHEKKMLALPADNDFTENYHLVHTIVQKFLNSVESKQKQRVIQKRQFLVRMNRPAMSKAFYSWKMISRSSKSNKDVASNMFAEPETPWNVRHPRSRFTNNWEGLQAFLLVYVAYTVTFRLCFNVEATGGAYFFDVLVDMYFICDVIFNFHTAFYDDSGDLVGVKDGLEGQPVADLGAMYRNYLRGWATIDLFSVMPTILMLFISTEKTSGDEMDPSQAKALKAIRLIRLAKLLRLVRAARLFKKYEEHFGPLLSLLMVFGIVSLVCHTITCVWFVIGTMPGYALDSVEERSVGWLQFVYSFDFCNCYDNETIFQQFYPDGNFDPNYAQAFPPDDSRFRTNGTYFDPYDEKCHSLYEVSHRLPMKPICDPAASLPTIADYYVKSMFFVFRNPQIHDKYQLSVGEMVFAIATTMIIGSCWGVVAGTFSTIFASNQLASQTYKMRIKQLKEFCRLKDLPHSISEKLEAHYHHLYPDKMMIDEEDVIADLPPQLREELVGTLYGRQLYSVPLFLNLDVQILTELCTKLVPLPALKGAIIAREGAKGTHMCCIFSGQIKVTETIKDGDDVGRLRHWIEDVYAHANRDLVLFKPSVNQQIDELVTRIRRIAREIANSENTSPRAGTSKKLVSSKQKSTEFSSTMAQSFDGSDSEGDDEGDELQQRLRAAAQSTALGRVQFKHLLYDDILIDMCRENHTNLRQLVEEAGNRSRIKYEGALELTKADPSGPEIQVVGNNSNESAGTAPEQMCNALKSGEVLLDLIKLLVPRLAQSDKTKKSTASRNLQNFFDIVTDVEGQFKMLPEMAFKPDDLLMFDQGSTVMQHERQRRVIACLLELGFIATHMEGYMGPKLNDVTLGTLGPTEFFGELSLLPIEGGWSHRRTAMVVQNSMLHTLSKADVQSVSDRFPELRHRLVDHAEDYQRVQAEAAAAEDIENLSTIKAKKVTTGRAIVITDQDPLAIVKAQLSQQDAKLEQLTAQMQQITDLLMNMRAPT